LDPTNPNINPLSITASQGLLQELFTTSPGDPFFQNFVLGPIDLSAYKGKTIRVRVAETNNQGQLLVGVDEFKVTATFSDSAKPPLSNVQLHNPGVVIGGVPHTTDPTITGVVNDNGTPANIAFIEFDPNDTGFTGSTIYKTTNIDVNGNFTFTVP